MATMWIFLLLFFSSLGSLSGAQHETLCTSNACFTLHMERLSFNMARQSCRDNGGYLMTQRHRQEQETLLSLLSLNQRQRQEDGALKFWIGLKLRRQDCVFPELPLRGFKWVSGDVDSRYSNWKKEPVHTCTEERCVHVDFSLLGSDELKWTAGRCKSPSYYACKFYFKGMCEPLALSGPGQIMFTAPFSKEPEKSKMNYCPLGTYANIICNDERSHFSVCRGSGDTYSWSDPGPFCKSGKRSCEVTNGGCEHLCHQEAEDVRCSCKEGHDLEANGFTCRTTDLCGPGTCEHQCVMRESGFFCKCPGGFVLSENQRNCTDVDECQSEVCGDHPCTNTPGSYTCACKDGFEKVNGKCTDKDECVRSKCAQICKNSIGSFSCYCNEGFALSTDGLSCVDVNECVSNRCLAEFVCTNTAGSFTCEKPHGVVVTEADASTRTPHITPAASWEEPAEEQTQENLTESLSLTTVELQHQSPHTHPPLPELVNVTQGDRRGNSSSASSSGTGLGQAANYRVMICVLGAVVPLLVLVAVTLFIAIFRCNRAKKEAKKNTTTDGYCWVSSGLDPRLEKLYESILTDDP